MGGLSDQKGLILFPRQGPGGPRMGNVAFLKAYIVMIGRGFMALNYKTGFSRVTHDRVESFFGRKAWGEFIRHFRTLLFLFIFYQTYH
jgi:hypothetical protein